MEQKQNESTELRPEGARVLDAPLVTMNVNDFIRQLKDEAAWDKNEIYSISIY